MEVTIQRLKRDKRGLSNVIVVMLSLILVVIIVANVVLWSYQMNQFDWERMQEKVEIADISLGDSISSFVTQNEYSLNTGSRVSGSYLDTYAVDGQYETFIEGFTEEGWLGGWHKRIKITIDHNNVNSPLTSFPLLIFLSNSSGRNRGNVSCVFDELQSEDAKRKIAITTADGKNQCFAEIERWDILNKRAWIWVRVPNISSSEDTVLYLYYDKNQADNTAYVGEPDSTPAENVWDDNYKLVMHFNETLGSQRDSTSNENYGLPQGGVVENARGIIDGADHFDGVDDRIQINDSPSLSFTNNELTIEAWVKFDSLPTREAVIVRKDNQWQLGFINSNTIRNLVSTNGVTGWTVANDENYPFQTNMWYYCAFVYDGSKIVDKVNGEQVGSTHAVTGSIADNSNPLYISYCIYTNNYLNGTVDEVRVSNTTRSTAWIRANYEGERDNLVVYGDEESVEGEPYAFDVVGVFSIDISSNPLNHIKTVELELNCRASDTGEKWHLKAYNWTEKDYDDNGFNDTGGLMPTTGWDTYSINLTDKWQAYVNENGTIYVKLLDSEADVTQTSVDIDFFTVRVVIDGTKFTFQNHGPLTSHLISLWVTNSTYHQRYDLDVFINSGDSVSVVRSDASLPVKPYTVKVVTEKGNIAIFTSR